MTDEQGAERLQLGLALPTEEVGPQQVVDLARAAESGGFDLVTLPDRINPWVDAQGHAPAVWPLVGAIAAATSNIRVVVHTTPVGRNHPVAVAHAAATASRLLDGGLEIVVSTGNAVDEYNGIRPEEDRRLDDLAAALKLMRDLWRGETTHELISDTIVRRFRLRDRPYEPIPIAMLGTSHHTVRLAAAEVEGLWLDPWSPPTALSTYHRVGGAGTVSADMIVPCVDDEWDATRLIRQKWRFLGLTAAEIHHIGTPEDIAIAASAVDPHAVVADLALGAGGRDEVLAAAGAYASRGVHRVCLRFLAHQPAAAITHFMRAAATVDLREHTIDLTAGAGTHEAAPDRASPPPTG